MTTAIGHIADAHISMAAKHGALVKYASDCRAQAAATDSPAERDELLAEAGAAEAAASQLRGGVDDAGAERPLDQIDEESAVSAVRRALRSRPDEALTLDALALHVVACLARGGIVLAQAYEEPAE